MTGVYYPSGGATCKIVNLSREQHGVRCSVETTMGSITNLKQIRAGEIDFGYVQSDWQHHAYNGTSVFEEAGSFKNLRSVFSLHPEVATVVVRKDSDFFKFDDLKRARVNIGSKGSGSAASWEALISRLGWTDKDQTDLSHLSTSALAEALCSGSIDAYFVLIGHPAALVEETQDQCDIRVLGIESEAVDALVEEKPYYVKAEIPADLYPFSDRVGSFGVVATFVTSAKMPDDIVYTLVRSVYENFDSFRRLHPALSSLSANDLIAFKASAPLHPGALKFFREKGLLPEDGQIGEN